MVVAAAAAFSLVVVGASRSGHCDDDCPTSQGQRRCRPAFRADAQLFPRTMRWADLPEHPPMPTTVWQYASERFMTVLPPNLAMEQACALFSVVQSHVASGFV